MALDRRCPDCGYVEGRDGDGWCPWCEAPLPEDRLDGCLVWLGLLLVCVGFWLLVIAGARWLLS